jgi:uncharacterized repeat protein (TIGR01451 family)
VTLTGQQNVMCWQQGVYGEASDGDGSGVALVEYRPVGNIEWLTADGTLYWAAEIPLTVTDTWQIEVRALDWYSHTSDVALAEFTVGQITDLALTKDVTPASAKPGQTITYSLAFANESRCMGRGVVITDSVPVSLTVTGVISTGVTIIDTGAVSPYVWQVQDLAPGESGIITITGIVSDTLPGGHVFTNTATIAAATADSDPSNSQGSASVMVMVEEYRTYLPITLRNK